MGVQQQIAPLPDDKTTELFLRAAFASKPKDAQIIIWTLPDKITRTFANIDEAITYVGECVAHKDVYFGVGTGSAPLEPHQRFTAKQVTGLIGFHIDVDVADPHAHKKKSLPPTKEAALDFIMGLGLEPTMVIDSGHGYHAHWLFEEPWSLSNSAERDTAAQYMRWWQQYARGAAMQRHAWNIDSTPDLSRILRVPGTVNWKVVDDPLPVTIEHFNQQARYSINQFLETLEANQEIAKLPQKGMDTEVSRRDLEGRLVIRENAQPPAMKFGKLIRESKVANDAFYHERDLPSASEEDYKLACAAFRQAAEGVDGMVHRTWTEQEVADLLIYHRRTYGYDLKYPGYYALTVSKALAEVNRADRLTEANASLDDQIQLLHSAKAQAQADSAPFDGADDAEEDDEEEGEAVAEMETAVIGAADDLSEFLDESDGVKIAPTAMKRMAASEHKASSGVTSLSVAAGKPKTKAKGKKDADGILSIRPAFDTGDMEGEDARQAILTGLSDIYNPIAFVDIVKLLSDPPQYRFTFSVRGKETSLTVKSLDSVVNMRQFRVAVGGATDQLMPQIKQQDWDKHVQAIMSAARPEEIGEEATDIGLVNGWLNGYVESATIDHDWDGQYIEEGLRTIVPYHDEHYLFMSDIIYWLRVHRNERTSPQALGALFRQRGMTLEKLPMNRGKSRTTKSAWWIPPSIMAPFLEAEKKYEV